MDGDADVFDDVGKKTRLTLMNLLKREKANSSSREYIKKGRKHNYVEK